MAEVSMAQDLNAPADKVWSVIGDFASLHRWHPAVERTEMEGSDAGSVRVLHIAGGGIIRERLDSLDASGRSLTYRILESPLPVQDYVSTLRIEDGDGRSTVRWSSVFEPSGAPEDEAVGVIEGIYQAGLDELKAMFGG